MQLGNAVRLFLSTRPAIISKWRPSGQGCVCAPHGLALEGVRRSPGARVIPYLVGETVLPPVASDGARAALDRFYRIRDGVVQEMFLVEADRKTKLRSSEVVEATTVPAAAASVSDFGDASEVNTVASTKSSSSGLLSKTKKGSWSVKAAQSFALMC